MTLRFRVLEHHVNDTIRTGRPFSVEEEDLSLMRESLIQVYKMSAGADGLKKYFAKHFKSIRIVNADSLELISHIYPEDTPN